MLNKKNVIVGGLVSFLIFSGYMFYQMVHKPWLPTEITLIKNHNKGTPWDNYLTKPETYGYFVKNPPYSLKARYKMVEDFLKNKPNLYSTKEEHSVAYKFSKEGWSTSKNFPYFYYIDRSYNDNPITFREAGYPRDFRPLDAFIPWGGSEGYLTDSIAEYNVDISSEKCIINSYVIVSKPAMYIESWFKNIKYDDELWGEFFYFRSGGYTLDIPECAGVSHEADNTGKGLRLLPNEDNLIK